MLYYYFVIICCFFSDKVLVALVVVCMVDLWSGRKETKMELAVELFRYCCWNDTHSSFFFISSYAYMIKTELLIIYILGSSG